MDYLSLGKVAEMCAVTRGTIWSYVKSGELKAMRTPGGHYRVSKKDLKEFVVRKDLKLKQARPISRTKILVVDDDTAVRRFITKVLANNDTVLEEAADGFEAGQKTIKFKPDILIVDIFMPKVDGFEVCRQMRKNPETKSTKIIAISGFDSDENRTKVLAAGADLFLAKPLRPGILKQAIESSRDSTAAADN